MAWPLTYPNQSAEDPNNPLGRGDLQSALGGRRRSSNLVIDPSMNRTFSPQGALDAVDRRLQQSVTDTRVEREQAQFDRAQGGTLIGSNGQTMSVAAALAAGAALRKQREMMQPNVAAQAQAQGGVSGRAMPQTGISQAEFGNPMSRFRQVMEPGLTREERQRRMRNFDGMDERAAGRAAGLQQARIQADGQVGAAEAEAQGSIAAALAGRGGGADANGDGVISTKERIAFAEKWAKLDQGRMIESLDPGKAPTQRPLTRGEQVLESELSRILLQGGQAGEAPSPAPDTMEQPPEMQQPDAPARTRGFPGGQVLNKLVPGLELLDPQSGIRRAMRGDLGGAAPSARGQQLPSQATLDPQGRPLPKGSNAGQIQQVQEFLRMNPNDPRRPVVEARLRQLQQGA